MSIPTVPKDTFSLPEGADRIKAQRAEYVDRLFFKGKTETYERKDERLGNAEALFVGEAFDESTRAIDESALNEEEKRYLREQLTAFPPAYGIANVGRTNPQTHYYEVTSRQVEIQVNPALRAALKNDTELLRRILLADSRAQIMSTELYGTGSYLTERAGEMVLIHALIQSGKGINGEVIDLTSDPIVIASKVDDSKFATEEKAALGTAKAAVDESKQAVEEAREAPQAVLNQLKTAATAHAKEALKAFDEAKGTATASISTYREKLDSDKKELDRQLTAAVEATKTALDTFQTQYGENADVSVIRAKLDVTPFVEWQFERDTSDAKKRLGHKPEAAPLIQSILELQQARKVRSGGIEMISNAERNLNNLAYAIQGDREHMEWWNDQRKVAQTWEKPTLQNVGGFAQAADFFTKDLPHDQAAGGVSQAVTAMKTAMGKKIAAEGAASSIEVHVEQLLLIVQGDREHMKWWKDNREVTHTGNKPDIATSGGFNTASAERLSELEAIKDIPEAGVAVTAVQQFGEVLSKNDAALATARSASSALQSKLHDLRRAVYLRAIKDGANADSLILQALQLLREIDHVRLGKSARSEYVRDPAFYFDPANDGRYEFKITDFGHIDAEGNLQCEGIAPGVAADLRRGLASHLNDYRPDIDRAPLAVDEVVHAARAAIGGAREEADKARAGFHDLRSEYSDLGAEALDMAAQADRLRAESSDVRKELHRVSTEAAQAHQEQISDHQTKERRLRSEKDTEAGRAERAEARVKSLLAAVGTLRAELDAANRQTFGAAAARKKAWEKFERATQNS